MATLRQILFIHEFTNKEFATYCGVSERTVRRWLQKNWMPDYGWRLLNKMIEEFGNGYSQL